MRRSIRSARVTAQAEATFFAKSARHIDRQKADGSIEEEAKLKKFNFETLGAAIVLAAVQLSVAQLSAAHAAWEPSRQVQIIVPAGPRGGADQTARIIQDIITKKKVAHRSWSDVATCKWQGSTSNA